MAGNRLVSIKQFNSDIDVSSARDAAVTNFDDNGTKVDEKKGREKGAIAYGVEEHLALLRVVSATSKSFNSSETSPEWRAAYKAMCPCSPTTKATTPSAPITRATSFCPTEQRCGYPHGFVNQETARESS